MNPYTTLDVPTDATAEDIKQAFRAKSKLHHPDKGGDHDTFVQIQLAYEVLTDPDRRKHFDETGSIDPRTPSPQSELLNLIAATVERLASVETTDVLDIVKRTIIENQKSYGQQAHQARIQSGKFAEAAKRLTSPGMTVNPAADLLLKRSQAFSDQAAKADLQREFGTRLLSLLEVYRYQVDKTTDPWTVAYGQGNTFADLLRGGSR